MSANKTEIFQDSPNSGEFKQCPNGHYYQGSACPYCRSNSSSNGTHGYTVEDPAAGNSSPYDGHKGRNNMNSTIPNGNDFYSVPPPTDMSQRNSNTQRFNGTMFGDEDSPSTNIGEIHMVDNTKVSSRYSRKLVGWLVTYSNDPLGMDYKIYEGRNIIGRDIECNISINDGRVSAKHAVILFRAGKYSITDSQSSHGTYVNDVDIELEPRYLKDGDVIRIGNTVFKFRSSI